MLLLRVELTTLRKIYGDVVYQNDAHSETGCDIICEANLFHVVSLIDWHALGILTPIPEMSALEVKFPGGLLQS